MKIRVLHPKIVQQFEENAQFQAKLHLSMAYFWMINIPLIVGVFFFLPLIWNRYGLFYTLICSLYANFATDYGALSAAQASQKADNKEPAPTSEPTPPWLWPQK